MAERGDEMRKLEIKESDIMQVAVQQEIHRSDESRYDHRLHGILLICSGWSSYEVAELFGHSPRTVQNWVNRFERSGFAGLEEIPRDGRPPSLGEKEMESLGKDLRRSPRSFGYEQNLWDGKLLSHHLAQRYKVFIGERQCRRLFKKLDTVPKL